MSTTLNKLYRSSPIEVLQKAYRRLETVLFSPIDKRKVKQTADKLRNVFSVYRVPNLKNISAEEFAKHVQSSVGVVDASTEGYSEDELDRQRDLSIRFKWGHHHDFGDFKMEGKMRDRHIMVFANFVAMFPVSLEDFKGKSILDIGCWTGGTTLLLAAVDARNKVVALEEVKKYAQMASFLATSFGIGDRVSVRPSSVYDCNTEEYYEKFDIVFFPGVIYHLSDPLLALRILFNSLKPGGFILIESMGIDSRKPICRFDGSLVHYSLGPQGKAAKERLNRGGWNWFVPSPSALARLMKEAGFDDIQVQWHERGNRVYGYGKKESRVGICKAGLSVTNIK